MVIIITCGKAKLKTDIPVPLEELYISYLTKGKIKLAKKLTDRVYLFSGVLGLVPLKSKSAWYDSQNKLPPEDLIEKQLQEYNFDGSKIQFIGQKKALKFLQKFLPEIENLFSNIKGVGDLQKQIYEELKK